MAYYTYDELAPIIEVISLEREGAVRDEIRRLEGLSSPVSKHGAASVSILPEQGKGQ
jgi:hypothetical protein